MKNETDFSKIDWAALKNTIYLDKSIVCWPTVFDTMDLTGISDAELCADALVAWANFYSGFNVHPNLSRVLIMIGRRLGISPTGENFMKWSEQWLKNSKNETSA